MEGWTDLPILLGIQSGTQRQQNQWVLILTMLWSLFARGLDFKALDNIAIEVLLVVD